MNGFSPNLPYVVRVSVPASEIGKRMDEMHQFYKDHWPTSQPTTSQRENDRDFVVWYFWDEDSATRFATRFDGQIIKRPDN
jgi:hypothetical protein